MFSNSTKPEAAKDFPDRVERTGNLRSELFNELCRIITFGTLHSPIMESKEFGGSVYKTSENLWENKE